MGKRKEPRIPQPINIRVWGMDKSGQPFDQTATVSDVSHHGARIEGIRCLKGPGETIGVQCRKGRARFKVIWVGQPGSSEDGQAGIECLEPDKYIWGPRPPQWAADTYVSGAPPPSPGGMPVRTPFSEPPQTERRTHLRIPCTGEMRVWLEGDTRENSQTGVLTDISTGGCYLQVMTPPPRGSRLTGELHIGDAMLPVRGEVRTWHPGIGMGIAFGELAPEARARLEQILERLTEATHAASSNYSTMSLTDAVRQRAPAVHSHGDITVLVELLEKKGVLTPGEFRDAVARSNGD